jgi:leucine efflux protein
VFAEFGVLNYLTYLVGAIFIILVPGPNTFFVLKTGIAHGVKKGIWRRQACLLATRC